MENKTLKAGKCTIYRAGEMMGNIHKIEVREVEVTRERYAQYENAIKVLCTPKGKRNRRGAYETYISSLLIIEGHGHPDPAPLFGEYKPTGNGVSVAQARHSACSDGWQKDFDATMLDYLRTSNAKVLWDTRGERIS